jgi:hypothetical protein
VIEASYRGRILSQQRQSTAAVIRVKGVSFNYLQFLWSSIGTIKRTQEKGEFAGALALAVELIDYLPESIKKEFTERAATIKHSLNLITTGKIPQIQRIPDFYLKGIFKNRMLQRYGNAAFQQFISELTTKLDNIGYMENTKVVVEGSADMDEQTWLGLQEKEGKKSSGKRKRSGSASGSLD